MKNISGKIFIGIVSLALLSGLGMALIAPKDVNEEENRYAEKIKGLSLASYLSSEFQDSVEKALADQMLASGKLKEMYNILTGKYAKFSMEFVSKYASEQNPEDHEGDGNLVDEPDEPENPGKQENTTNRAIDTPQTTQPAIEQTTKPAVEQTTTPAVKPQPTTSPAVEPKPQPGDQPDAQTKPKLYKYRGLGNGYFDCQGYLVTGLVSPKNSIATRMAGHIDNLNMMAAKYPELDWFIYYIEDESDTSFSSGNRSGSFEYLKERLTEYKPENVERLLCDNFEDYSKYFYKSDHHWAADGSYRGYTDMLSMLKPGVSPLKPIGDPYRIGVFYGSFTKTDATSAYYDVLYAYEYPFPEMEISFATKPQTDYGTQTSMVESAKAGKLSGKGKTSYAVVYGSDVGEIIFHNPQGSGSLLVFGNSYDNAVLKLLASHYEYLYSIDMRYYKSLTGKDFSFSGYLEAHPDISQVLQLGTIEYFIQAPYILNE